MKPVVSSLVALALAIAPLSAMAKPHAKPAHAKVVKHHKAGDKIADKSDKADASEKSEKAPIVQVKAGRKDGASIKPVLHHAHNVDLGGAGHKEPKIDHTGAIIPASMTTRTTASSKSLHATPAPKANDLPKLPNPSAGKPSKGGAEKGARKAAEKKHDSASDANDGEPARDEEFAELVARIRGRHAATSDGDKQSTDVEPRNVSEKGAKMVSHTTSKAPCTKDPVEIIRGPEVERFELMNCDGTLAPLAVEHLSILIRPGGAARPTAPIEELAKKPGAELAHGVRRVDQRLVERIQSVAEHFGKPGSPAKLSIISGYRPASVGSMHSTGRAVDLRVEGAKNEDVVAFCRSLMDTGCGYYPNSSFVHVDVRDAGAGHVTWIDASGPGETPRYVTSWPPPSPPSRHLARTSMSQSDLAEEGANILRARRPLDRESAPEAVDEHPAEVAQ
jgi:hypothetical protein